MFIRSERLFLRPGWPEDWDELLPLIADALVVRNLTATPWPYAAEDAKEFVRKPQEKLAPHFVVTLPSGTGTKLVGCAGLAHHGENVHLGYWIAREHWGQGYATEASRAVLGLAAALGHRRIMARHFTDNPASGRVLAKLGFRPTGETQCFSAYRGGEAPAQGYVLELATGGDSGDDGVMLAA